MPMKRIQTAEVDPSTFLEFTLYHDQLPLAIRACDLVHFFAQKPGLNTETGQPVGGTMIAIDMAGRGVQYFNVREEVSDIYKAMLGGVEFEREAETT